MYSDTLDARTKARLFYHYHASSNIAPRLSRATFALLPLTIADCIFPSSHMFRHRCLQIIHCADVEFIHTNEMDDRNRHCGCPWCGNVGEEGYLQMIALDVGDTSDSHATSLPLGFKGRSPLSKLSRSSESERTS
ncbi:hypothetical protein K443DRAFT_255397 [Laccaria amethystina LaAM-08-1]|uniref:Uncharacterized protein n=1 Tax=Laccaria amethystina LaAM-08-1 TaxID=1095629 RepID=A0A0C9X7E7_9AGAR|nr:hypothetical protein K443DRAFT_255397 [Laccaria amethystina LaAM-08-1]